MQYEAFSEGVGRMNEQQTFIEKFNTWAQQQADIRAVFLVGSIGRKAHSAWSDVDIAFVTKQPKRYHAPHQWLSELGTVWAAVYDANDPLSGLSTSATVFSSFEAGLSVDFSILPYRSTWLWLQLLKNSFMRKTLLAYDAAEASYLFSMGVEILYDPDNFLKNMQTILTSFPRDAKTAPSQAAFQALQDDFYLGAVQLLRYLMRGLKFAAISQRDRPMRRSLIKLMQWHAQAKQNNWDDGLKFRDKKIETWAEAEILKEFPSLFGGYEEEAIWQALRTSLSLFARLSQEFAEIQGYQLDKSKSTAIIYWVEEQYQT